MNATTREMTQWGAQEWERWAGIDAGRDPGNVRVQPDLSGGVRRDHPAIGRIALARAVVGFGLFAALLSLLPYRIPGEARAADLRPIERPLCAACPAAQQITAAGVRVDRGRPWLTVRFAAPPRDASFQVLVGAPETPVLLQQRPDGDWTMASPSDSGLPLGSFMVGARGDRAVFELPAGATAGVALRSSEHVRFPPAGTFAPLAEQTRGPNMIDFLIAAAAAFGAWRGYKSGALAMATHLAAVAVIVLLLKSISRALVATSGMTGIAVAFGYGAVIALAGIGVHMLMRRGAGLLFRPPVAEPGERGLGTLLGVLRAAVIAALLLAIMSDQALVDAVSTAIDSSLAGTWLVGAWRALIL